MISFKFKLIAMMLVFGIILVAGTVITSHTMLKNSLIKYVDQRDQQHLKRIKNNIEYILDEKLEDNLNFLDEVTWKKIVSISSRVDFTETFVPVDLFLSYPFSDFKQRHPDFAEQRLSLLDTQQQCKFGYPTEDRTLFIPIEHDKRTIGYIGYSHRAELTESVDIQLAERQRTLLTYGVIIVVLLSGLLLLPVGHYFLSPIQAVTQGMRSLTAGRFNTRLVPNRRDELGQLLQDFNHLATSLEKNQQSRNQWVADISHELRTPLTILRGELEALKDGVRPFNQQNLDGLYSEVLHLTRLVEDLYQIALNDVGGLKYQMLPLEFSLLTKQTLQSLEPAIHQKGLKLSTHYPSQPLRLCGDGDRLQQMLSNLVNNSIAYTDVPGEIRLTLKTKDQHLFLTLEDSAPGVPDQVMPHLFERFFRGESSRNRRYGGAGIGLALVAQIVQAHQGQLDCKHSELGGLAITIQLPLEAYTQ